MTARQVEAGQGWQWVVEGWRLFLKAPGLWIVMLLIYIVISIALSFIPLIGGVADALITPALMGGMIYGAAAVAGGQDLEIQHLFRAFQDRNRLGPMLNLGALLLVGYIIVGLVVGGFLASWMVGGGMMSGTQIDQQTLIRMMMSTGMFVMLIVMVVGVAITMAMFYAIPLVMLAGSPPIQALRDSFAACWLNMGPFLVFGLIYLVLAFLAAIPLGLGFLVLGPVTFGAVYSSYQDVFVSNGVLQKRTQL